MKKLIAIALMLLGCTGAFNSRNEHVTCPCEVSEVERIIPDTPQEAKEYRITIRSLNQPRGYSVTFRTLSPYHVGDTIQ